MLASVELKDLVIKADIGTYAQGGIVPNEHRLDLRVWIDPSLVLIDIDDMKYVFDYDPLVKEIDRLAQECHYETQERLITRIGKACAAYPQIKSVEIGLKKFPVINHSGTLGVRLLVDSEQLNQWR